MCYNMRMLKWLRTIILGDMFFLTAFGLISPIFALFLKDQLPGANVLGVALAEAFFLLALGVIRPFAKLYSKNDTRGWRTQNFLWFGSCLVIAAPFLYLLSRDMLDIYVVQVLYGVGIAFSEPAWSRLVDLSSQKDQNPSVFEQYNTLGTLIAAALAGVGGFVAQYQGMRPLLVFLGTTLACASLLMWFFFWHLAIRKPRTV